jgi:hypothetical protein
MTAPFIGVLAQAPGAPLTSSAWIRLLLPLQQLERQGGCRLLELPPLADEAELEAWPQDLAMVIVQRAACPQLPLAQALLQVCRQRSLPLLLDLDDALFALPPDHPERQRYAPALPAIEQLLRHADLRVFSTQPLADLCASHLLALDDALPMGPSQVLANGLDADLWAGPVRFPGAEPEGPLRLLSMGSRTHDADLQLMLPALAALAAREPQLFRLTLIGGMDHPPAYPWLEVLEVPLQARRYPRFVRWLRRLPRHHLGLAPLVANAFNAAKSDVKLLDYAALGLPCLCSPGPAYQAWLSAGLALSAEHDQWAEQIRWAATHRRRLRRLGQAAHGQLWQTRCTEAMASSWRRALQVVHSSGL